MGIICEPQCESWELEVDPLKEQVLHLSRLSSHSVQALKSLRWGLK